MDNGREFPIEAIIAITTGNIISDFLVDVYDLVSYVTGRDTVNSSELLSASVAARLHILVQYPGLANKTYIPYFETSFEAWMQSIKAEFGEKLIVKPQIHLIEASKSPEFLPF